MLPRTRDASLVLANLLIPIAVLTFATGFFPYKPFISGLAQYKDLEYGPPPEAQFDKIVFMVVDALRSDFVYSDRSGFEFTQSLIRSGEAIPFTAHATSPTITMPRVKAITTGSIPSFLDVILNFAESDTTSTLANQDTWLAQIKAKENGRLVMYGDDTWLKLFPDTFVRADGTSSFFVSDFTEVDNNVTRHVPTELRNVDWNAMILHYLGLDHIGHKAGPLSPNMIPKQREMDGIVKEIYQAIRNEPHLKSTLFILCGDHGMNEGGNHGGSAPGETSPALVFMSPKFKKISVGIDAPTLPADGTDFDFYSKIEQSDVAPTIAGLLGFPVPLNNLGIFIPTFLKLWEKPVDRAQLILRNALQMLDILKATFPNEGFDKPSGEVDCNQETAVESLSCLWQTQLKHQTGYERIDDPAHAETNIGRLYQFCRDAQGLMSSTASNYDVQRLVTGIAIAAVSVLLAILALRSPKTLLQGNGLWYCLTSVLYGAMMFASSYVEEEQHFWYWMTAGWLAVLGFAKLQTGFFFKQSYRRTTLITLSLLLLHRISRRWNQTGQKHAGAPDIVHDLLLSHPPLLGVLVLITFTTLSLQISRQLSHSLKLDSLTSMACASILSVPALMFKASFTASDAPELVEWLGTPAVEALKEVPLIGTARIVFAALALESVFTVIISRRRQTSTRRLHVLPSLHTLLTLFLITQTRVHNIPLFAIFTLQLTLLHQLNLTPLQTSITTLLMTHTSFFALGNSNAISSIDLSNAYNGVSGYNVLAVGLLVFLSNWAGPVWWASAGVCLLAEGDKAKVVPQPSSSKRSWVQDEHRHLSTLAASTLQPSQRDVPADATAIKASPFRDHVALMTLFTSAALLAVMLACTLLRTHLFIWTVFSPKYLYAMAWSLAFHFGVTVGVGSGLWSLRS